MIELEVYAAGLRNIDKILELDHLLRRPSRGCATKWIAITISFIWKWKRPGLPLRELRAMFRKIGLEPRFIGAVPDELRAKSKTQPLAS